MEDVCRIIDTSAKAGVTELKFGDLHVHFGMTVEKMVGITPYPVQHAPAYAPVKDLTEEQHQKQNKDAIEAAEVDLREEQMARLLVEDPEAYERLLQSGELGDAVDTADDSDGEE